MAMVLMLIGPAAFALTCPSSGRCDGGSGNDMIVGNDNYNEIHGHQGDDNIFAYAIGDLILGENDADTIRAHRGNDDARTSENSLCCDVIAGGNGDDKLLDQYSAGNVYVDYERDYMCADTGKDRVNIQDGDPNDWYYRGGGGKDSITIDPFIGCGPNTANCGHADREKSSYAACMEHAQPSR